MPGKHTPQAPQRERKRSLPGHKTERARPPASPVHPYDIRLQHSHPPTGSTRSKQPPRPAGLGGRLTPYIKNPTDVRTHPHLQRSMSHRTIHSTTATNPPGARRSARAGTVRQTAPAYPIKPQQWLYSSITPRLPWPTTNRVNSLETALATSRAGG